MSKINYKQLDRFIISDVMTPFYEKRFKKLREMKLQDVLKRKNPYLYKAKNIQLAGDFSKYLLDAFLSSQEETIFGNLLEELAIHICSITYGGHKAEEGKFGSVDLIFKKGRKTYIVGIKSGPYWGNADQLSKMRNNFKKAKKILRAEGKKGRIIAVNGCVYGKENNPFKKHKKDYQKNYYKLCGQSFWRLISNESNLYKILIIPLDKEAKKKDEQFQKLYIKKINEMTKDLVNVFYANNTLDWSKILDYVSKEQSKNVI